MRTSSLATVALFVASASAVAIQCPPVDKDGTPFVSSNGDANFVRCTYQGAGPCEYFPANGSFSSGSSSCPVGIAQDPSVTTDALSSADAGGGAGSTSDSGTPASFSTPPVTLNSDSSTGTTPPSTTTSGSGSSPATTGSASPSASGGGNTGAGVAVNPAGTMLIVSGASALLGAFLL